MRKQRSTNTGRYAHSFLDIMVGKGNFGVNSLPIPTDSEEFAEAVAAISRSGFANVSDTGLTYVKFGLENNGWMDVLGDLVVVRNSPKVAKRLTLITRLAYLAGKFNTSDLLIASVNSDEFSNMGNDVKFLDGANVISTELVDKLMTQGSRQFPARVSIEERARVNKTIDKAGSFSIRILTPEGLIKGDAFAVPREKMGGYDVLYHEENLKTELMSKDFLFVLAEAHPRHNRVAWLDEQTDSWLGTWLFPQEEKDLALRDYLALQIKDLEEGNFPRVFDDPEILSEEGDLIDQFRQQALKWVEGGMKLNQSIFIFSRISEGMINMFLQPRRPEKDRKLRIPVRCAWNSFVATDAWLAMAGYEEDETPKGMTWYHEPTDRMILNDETFAEAYERHGGWDLDDMPMWVFRTINGERKVICIRRPNGPGEYSIFDFKPGTAKPTWERANGEMVEFPLIQEIGKEGHVKRPPFLEELDIIYTGMPEMTKAVDPEYNVAAVVEALKTAMDGFGTFGRWANAQMVFNRSTGSHRTRQLAPTETIIDTCTQEPTPEKLAAIEKDTQVTLVSLAVNRVPVDRKLWALRVGAFDNKIRYVDGPYTQLWKSYIRIVTVAHNKLKAMAQSCRENVPTEIIAGGRNEFARQGQDLVVLFRKRAGEVRQVPEDNPRDEATRGLRRKFWSDLNDRMVTYFLTLSEPDRHKVILAMANFCYTKKQGDRFKDTVLFGSNMDNKLSVYDLYIEAIKSVLS
ncbi:MAG TPA: hypothetical protein VJ742_12500 [Nitrososphaera sp.]|nr:hypothetical protein [Nitrososphaera sp.]